MNYKKYFNSGISIILTFAVLISALVFGGTVKTNALSLDVSLGYYNSTQSSEKLSAQKNVATRIFTRDELPNGTEIKIAQGFRYRPEGWVELDQTNTTRPSMVYGESTVIVDDEWWGDYKYRAFYISEKNESLAMSSYVNNISSIFTITLPEEIEEKTIRVLAIGNSFSNDAYHYAEQIAAEFGYKTEFYSLYASGCSLETHLSNYNNNKADYTIYRNGVQVRGSVTMNQILKECDYDYITLQQASAGSNDWSTYEPYLESLYDIVKEQQPNAQVLIHQTWGYYQRTTHFPQIEECYDKAAALLGGLPIVKSGKAIQITKDYNFLADGRADEGVENAIYADEYSHLTDKGDFIASCVLVETIFGVDTTTKDFTSLFSDAKNLTKAAHSAVTGEPIVEDEGEEEIYYEPKRTMLQYKRTSNGYYKLLYKLPTTLEANTEYTVTLAIKHVTSTTNMIFGLYGINKSTSVGQPTYDALNATGALLRSSDSSGVAKFGIGAENNYGTHRTYTFTLTEDEIANKQFYIGYYFNRSEGVELYVSDFALYKSNDENKKSILGVDDYSTDASAWCTPYGESASNAKYVEYNPSYFKTAYHIYMDSSSTEKLAIRIPANLVKADTKYTISFNYYMMNRGLDYGIYTMLYGMNTDSGKNLKENAYSLRCFNGTAVTGSKMKSFTDVSGNVIQSRQGKASYSFTVTSGDDLFNYYYVGFYLLKSGYWTTSPDFYLTDLKLCEEGSDVNLIPADEYTTSHKVGDYAWKEGYGWAGNSGCGFSNAYVPAYTGDANMDGEVDVRDLVKINEDATASLYNLFADTNEDKTTDKYDVNNIRYQLLGLGITAPKAVPKPVVPDEPETPEDTLPFEEIPSGDVTATKTASKTTAQTVLPGETVSYTVKLTNNDLTAQDAVLFEKLPEGTTLVSGDCELKNGYIAWSGEIDALETGTVNYTLKIDKNYDLCGTVLDGSKTQVNNNFASGYDLYIERTAVSNEDQRFISNGIRAMKDSTYRDKDLLKWIYYIAFSKSAVTHFDTTAEATLDNILNGTATEQTLNMVAPTLYGGSDVKGAINGIKGEPCENVTVSDLIVGDVLFVKNGSTTKNYIYDKDGLVDLSAPMSTVDTNAVLSALSTSKAFAVFRPSIVINRDYILDEEMEELDLTEQQQAVIATAESYILRGEKLQYDDDRFNPNASDMEYRWMTDDRNPEYSNVDEWGYINCAGFTHEVYVNALGIEFISGTSSNEVTKLCTTQRLLQNTNSIGIRKYYFKRELEQKHTDEQKQEIKTNILNTIEPGDLLVIGRDAKSYGHVVLYIGNGTFIHSTGSTRGAADKAEVCEPTIRYMRVEDYFFTEGSGGYIFYDSIKSSQVDEFAIVRPLDKESFNVEVPEETQNRINNLQGIMAQKRNSHKALSANLGEEVTFTFEVYNTNDTAKTVEICDTVPQNTTYVSGADNIDGENLSWTKTIPANTRIEVSYTVKVNENAAIGDYIQTTDTSTVGGVRVVCPKVYINRTLTAAEQQSIIDAYNEIKDTTTNTGFALVNEIYKKAGLTETDVFADTDYTTVTLGTTGLFTQWTNTSVSNTTDRYKLNDSSPYKQLLVPTLYGGLKCSDRHYSGNVAHNYRTERTRILKKHNIMVGDIYIQSYSSSNRIFIYLGGDKFLNISSTPTQSSNTIEKDLERGLTHTGKYFAVLRPSFNID